MLHWPGFHAMHWRTATLRWCLCTSYTSYKLHKQHSRDQHGCSLCLEVSYWIGWAACIWRLEWNQVIDPQIRYCNCTIRPKSPISSCFTPTPLYTFLQVYTSAEPSILLCSVNLYLYFCILIFVILYFCIWVYCIACSNCTTSPSPVSTPSGQWWRGT